MQEYAVVGFKTSVQKIKVSYNTTKAWELSQVRRNHPCRSEGNVRGLGWLEEPPDIQVCKAQRVAVPRLEGKNWKFCNPRPSPCGLAVDTGWGQEERFCGWAASAGVCWCPMLRCQPSPCLARASRGLCALCQAWGDVPDTGALEQNSLPHLHTMPYPLAWNLSEPQEWNVSFS